MATESRTEPEFELVLTRKETIADGVVRLTLAHPGGEPLPSWEPGAHLELEFGDELVRQYSLCGDPRNSAVFQVAVLLERNGRGGSRYVHDTLGEGMRVRVRGPRNNFALVEAKRYLFLAGGIGITPILPMLEYLARTGREWRLVYGGRTRASMAFRAELEARYPGRVQIRPQDEYGLLDLPAVLAGPGAEVAGTAVYCCGPEALLSAVEEHCASRPGGALHVERFSPRADVEDGPRGAFEVRAAETGTLLRVPAESSILEVTEEAGIPVLSSCREGTCGTCETPVLDGTPEHRDSVLTDEEKEAGDTMMICVSRSRSARLVLEL